jgi:hypothetical protein
MSEKVLFEFRAEENEDGYTFAVKHDKDAFPFLFPFMRGRLSPAAREKMAKRWQRFHKFSKRRMRRKLNFYERMYEDLYSPQEEGEE